MLARWQRLKPSSGTLPIFCDISQALVGMISGEPVKRPLQADVGGEDRVCTGAGGDGDQEGTDTPWECWGICRPGFPEDREAPADLWVTRGSGAGDRPIPRPDTSSQCLSTCLNIQMCGSCPPPSQF